MIRSSRKVAATLGALTIAGSAGLVALAPTASAGTVTPQVTCEAPAPVGTQTGPMSLTVNGPAEAAAGADIKLTIDPGTSPVGSPVSLDNVDIDSTYTFGLSGAKTGTQDFAKSTHFDKLPTGGIDSDPFEVTLTVPADATAGQALELTWNKLVNVTKIGGSPLATVPCTPGADNGVVYSFTVKAGDPNAPTLQVTPAEVEPGKDITLAGTNWPASGTAKAELCAADGTGCAEAGFSAQSPAIDASGKLSGTATVAADKADGDYQVKVTAGETSKTAALKVKKGGGSTPPPGGEEPMDPKQVHVAYNCVTTPPLQPPSASELDVTVTVPKTAAKGDKVEVKADFKEGRVGTFPADVPAPGTQVQMKAALQVGVSDGKGYTSAIGLEGPTFDVTIQPGADMKTDALKAQWTVPGGGMFSFTPGNLTLSTMLGGNEAAKTECSVTGAVEVSAQMKATGEAPPPTGGGTQGGTAGNTSGNTGGSNGSTGTTGTSGGDLAKTGTGGSTVNAFALVAGTAVLAALGVLLVIPYRRRTRARG